MANVGECCPFNSPNWEIKKSGRGPAVSRYSFRRVL